MAETLKELKNLVDKLYAQYGDCPLDYRVFLGEIPGEHHAGFHDKDVKSVIEVSFDQNW